MGTVFMMRSCNEGLEAQAGKTAGTVYGRKTRAEIERKLQCSDNLSTWAALSPCQAATATGSYLIC